MKLVSLLQLVLSAALALGKLFITKLSRHTVSLRIEWKLYFCLLFFSGDDNAPPSESALHSTFAILTINETVFPDEQSANGELAKTKYIRKFYTRLTNKWNNLIPGLNYCHNFSLHSAWSLHF